MSVRTTRSDHTPVILCYVSVPSFSVSSKRPVLWHVHAVRQLIEGDGPPKQPAPRPLQEYQQLQSWPGQHTSFSWWGGAKNHREQGELCLFLDVSDVSFKAFQRFWLRFDVFTFDVLKMWQFCALMCADIVIHCICLAWKMLLWSSKPHFPFVYNRKAAEWNGGTILFFF